jgi:predicted enzyme related to lactoylglutathione lyase
MGKRSAGYGFIAYFTDTEDNLMGLWQTARH